MRTLVTKPNSTRETVQVSALEDLGTPQQPCIQIGHPFQADEVGFNQ